MLVWAWYINYIWGSEQENPTNLIQFVGFYSYDGCSVLKIGFRIKIRIRINSCNCNKGCICQAAKFMFFLQHVKGIVKVWIKVSRHTGKKAWNVHHRLKIASMLHIWPHVQKRCHSGYFPSVVGGETPAVTSLICAWPGLANESSQRKNERIQKTAD